MESWFQFLRLEADLAITFIATARTFSVIDEPTNSARSLANARKALKEIRSSLAKPAQRGLTEDEIVLLEVRCSEIEFALTRLLKITPVQ